MTRVFRAGVLLFSLVFAAAACTSPAPTATRAPAATVVPAPTATATTVPAPTAAPAATPIPLPEATGAALWEYLEMVDYQGSWELWPGTTEKYPGAEPHGMLLTTYVNPVALEALDGKAGVMPEGAIVLKENYMPDGALAAITTMYKVAGYNPEHNDWFFAKQAPDGTVQAEGKVAGCQTCHDAESDNDYLFTGPLE